MLHVEQGGQDHAAGVMRFEEESHQWMPDYGFTCL
jgi:hypothetical protein